MTKHIITSLKEKLEKDEVIGPDHDSCNEDGNEINDDDDIYQITFQSVRFVELFLIIRFELNYSNNLLT